ncbi:hypothetical protein CLOM_g8434, partial [Closterium sp. NIES-68]
LTAVRSSSATTACEELLGRRADQGATRRGGEGGGVVWVDLRNTRVDPETYFKELENATNIRMATNLGMLTYMATQASGPWAERFKALGMRLPYAVGCFFRFLLRPCAEVQEMFHSTEQRLRASTGDDSSRRVAVVGIHIRVQDEVVWGPEYGAPKKLSWTSCWRTQNNGSTALRCGGRVG